jgi:predicted acylesterase/phospholipase RssA
MKPMKTRKLFLFLLVGAAAVLQGCSIPTRQAAVPAELVTRAEVPGMPGVRYAIGGDMAEMAAEGLQSVQREMAYRASTGQQGPLPPANFLAISGGGDDGAYGAGLLCGWTAAGTRPEFKLVTGISTGALTAPFAFLGPKYDHVLREVYTQTRAKDILTKRGFTAAVYNDAMADNAPLWQLTKKYVTADFLREVAAEHAKGRILLIGTTNLDARRPIIWNMTKIAASDDPKAADLFSRIMIASAAIPGAFPPMLIDVEVDGKRYQEMHVDGGAVTQVFVYPPALQLKKVSAEAGVQRDRHLYVVRNARLDPDWSEVERRTLSIAGLAISSLIRTQGVGDLYRIYAIAQRDGVDYNLAFIPPTFNAPRKEDFDPAYMQPLFQLGYDSAVQGYPWAKAPPGL